MSNITTSNQERTAFDQERLAQFRQEMLAHGRELYRDFPWRRTTDPYGIWVSEVMLQQTQTARVDGRWQRWIARFPSIEALAQAPVADVLEEWQGLGYNRRALALQQAAQALVRVGGIMPDDADLLCALPGIGPATAAGIIAFAFDKHAVYLETNVRTVFLHELFAGQERVADKSIIPLVAATCPRDASDPADDPRTWYYALLDYGAHLKRIIPNPSRRSRTHTKQSRFEGSRRQKRAFLVRAVLARRGEAVGVDLATLTDELNKHEVIAGREPVERTLVAEIMEELVREGFCTNTGESWRV